MPAPTHRICRGPCKQSRTLRHFKPRGWICDICQKAKAKQASRNRHVTKTYDLTEEDYIALKRSANGRCMICGEPRQYELAIEHDHVVARSEGVARSVRGLACKRCNGLLRRGSDSASLFRALAAYLDDWPSYSLAFLSTVGHTTDRRA